MDVIRGDFNNGWWDFFFFGGGILMLVEAEAWDGQGLGRQVDGKTGR